MSYSISTEPVVVGGDATSGYVEVVITDAYQSLADVNVYFVIDGVATLINNVDLSQVNNTGRVRIGPYDGANGGVVAGLNTFYISAYGGEVRSADITFNLVATLTAGVSTDTTREYTLSASSAPYTINTVYIKGPNEAQHVATTNYSLVGETLTLGGLTPGDSYSVYVSVNTGLGLVTSNTVADAVGSGSGSGSGSGAVPCIPAGQRILTQRGLVPVEALQKGDRLATADGRLVDFKLYKTVLKAVVEKNAPIRIERGATAVELSPLHMMQVRRGVWVKPAELLAAGAPGVSRVRVGEDVVYYHMEMPDYLRDNMVVEGCVVESFGLPWVHRSGFKGSPYTWNARLGGYTRLASWNGKTVLQG